LVTTLTFRAVPTAASRGIQRRGITCNRRADRGDGCQCAGRHLCPTTRKQTRPNSCKKDMTRYYAVNVLSRMRRQRTRFGEPALSLVAPTTGKKAPSVHDANKKESGAGKVHCHLNCKSRMRVDVGSRYRPLRLGGNVAFHVLLRRRYEQPPRFGWVDSGGFGKTAFAKGRGTQKRPGEHPRTGQYPPSSSLRQWARAAGTRTAARFSRAACKPGVRDRAEAPLKTRWAVDEITPVSVAVATAVGREAATGGNLRGRGQAADKGATSTRSRAARGKRPRALPGRSQKSDVNEPSVRRNAESAGADQTYVRGSPTARK